MSKTNDEKFKDAERAIDALFSDTSVGPETTKDKLQELAEKIQTMIEALESDLKNV